MPYKDRDVQRKYQRERNARRREAWLEGKCCAVCKSVQRLEVDHIDPKLKISHNVWSWAEARMLAELAKCQVLCHDCHLEKTIQFLSTAPKHGATAYRYGCRCDICREAQRLRKIAQKVSKPLWSSGNDGRLRSDRPWFDSR